MFQVSQRQEIREGLQLDPVELTEYQKKLLVWEGQGFDLRVHITDPKSGQLLKYQPYRRQVSPAGVVYHRKDESGVERRYTEQGLPLDPVERPKNDKKLS